MHRIDFHIEAGSSLIVTGASLSDVVSYIPGGRLFIITDGNVRRLYGEMFPYGEVLEIKAGEPSKRLSVVEDLCLRLAEAGADRQSFLLGIGGGVVCDITGLVASLYMRGVRHGFVSATLLSQVDASVGGKTGVDAGNYKNIIGTFRLPQFVLCDVSMLLTLSDEEFVSGLGELIKTALIADRKLFDDIVLNQEEIKARNTDVLEHLIYRSLLIKTDIVRDDFTESGRRRLLNFGHTFGHALEMINGMPHGIAVMQGMLLASKWSLVRNELPADDYQKIESLIFSLGVPAVTSVPEGFEALVSGDKKKSGDHLHFVFLDKVGSARVEKVALRTIFEFLSTIPVTD